MIILQRKYCHTLSIRCELYWSSQFYVLVQGVEQEQGENIWWGEKEIKKKKIIIEASGLEREREKK